MVNITKVNTEYNGQTAYCEEETITTLGTAINRRVLWSRYKVKPTKPLGPPLDAVVKEEGIGGPPIRFHLDKVDNDFSGSDIEATDSKDKLSSRDIGAEEKVDMGDTESVSAYPNRPLWRGRICDLLNDDLTVLGKAKIIVCLLDESFDEENLGDTDVGVLFLWDGDF